MPGANIRRDGMGKLGNHSLTREIPAEPHSVHLPLHIPVDG